jgi:uncharacterized protein
MHARFAPKAHRFVYRIFLFALDLDELDALHRKLRLFSFNRRNLYAFREQDYLPTGEPVHNSVQAAPHSALRAPQSLKARIIAHLSARGIDLAGGRVLLVTLPRVLGYLFNPVSFYFCYDRTGTPVAALAEVTNTFKEMKPYLLGPETKEQRTEDGEPRTDSHRGPSSIRSNPSSVFRLRVPKHFYVSPFSDVDVAFDFQLRTPGDRLSVQIDDYVGAARTLTSTLTGPRQPLTDARLAWFTLKYPLITLKVISLIHWHALRLWWKNVPWFAKSARPADQRELYRPHASLAPSPAATPVSLSLSASPKT